MNIPKIDLPRIVVIGCGFAGLKFSNKIDTRKYQVILLDKNNYHTFQPLLYQVASSGLEPDSIAYPVRKIFKGKEHFHFRIADTESIDHTNKLVHTSLGDIDYDILVIATGATSNYFGMEGIKKYAMPLKSLIEAINLRSLIIQNFEEALNTSDLLERERLMNFVVVGAGPTGMELAGALAELKKNILPADYPDLDIRRMQIHIIEANNRPLASMSEKASKKAAKYLKKMGVQLWLDTFVKSYDGETATTNKDTFFTTTLIWAAGIEGSAPKGINFNRSKGNRIIVNEYNQVAETDQVYAIGDIAQIESKTQPKGHPMLASVAEQQGHHLAKNLNQKASGKKLTPFKYNDKGSMATIGRNKAVVDLPFMTFGGIIGWFTWMFVHLMLLVDFRSRLVVFINWVWSYIRYDKGTRLIIRKYDKPKVDKSQ
ncbi:NAD(P)/FAD-dependent oxidoreductase [Putridiphycobacter roseus]|uniref:NADH:ubiquinone reductase (non-electrogenic) n=1 Tax=Putridiphycobacter roseus TaxID=2219161 RepID=A0A2W1NN07_9FLAO|nr:NAD(P)/FAD-dependent oxidoreductase [Putridiphycobacter roseus]PZE17062.1 NAD(P)/FAD-dependent oxidoreductase [Putridiphycobacter roseus]